MMTVWRVSSDTHDAVGLVHAVLLDGVDGGVHLAARAVEIRGVYMDAQRLAADLLGMDAGRIGQPVVGMDDVVVEGARHHAGDDGVVVDFLVKVSGIATGKLHGTEIIDVHVVEVGIQMVAKPEIKIRIHDVAYALTHIVAVDVAPRNGHGIHGHDAAGRAVFVAERFRQTQGDVHIALGVQSLRYAVVGGGESTEHVRRILPSKH